MKKTYFLLLIAMLSFSVKAQTTLKYSGIGTTTYAGIPVKVATVIENLNTISPASIHVGLISTATNGSNANYGIVGTTRPNVGGVPQTANTYIGVFGDNSSNSLSINNASVVGGAFYGKNTGSGSNAYGAICTAEGVFPKTSETIGLDAASSNSTNTVSNSVIAVRGITTSGNSTPAYLKGVANPGGYFKSDDGQGIYATTSDGYNGTFGKVSTAVMGYSNLTSAYLNAGVSGYAEGTGVFKFGVYGYLDGTAGTSLSAAIVGQDAIGSSSTYAGYFYGKVGTNSNLLVAGTITGTTANFTGCVTASNLTCPSDSRYKKNIASIENPLSNLLKINGVRYDWKMEEFPEKNFSDKNQIGFIAQEIEKVFPEMVFTDEKGFKSVDYARLTPLLVEAIKELSLKNQKLQNRLEKIEEILSVSASKK